MRVPKRRGEELRKLKVQDNHLTKAKIQRMKDELERLKAEQPEARAEVQRTGEMGDFSENAAYQMAKGRLRRILNRITVIEEKLKVAIPIEEGVGEDGMIGIGVRVRLESEGSEFVYEIVGEQEADPMQGRISYLSPLGKQLIGKQAGDEVEIENTVGRKVFHIVEAN
jgi:transcription elongation factor GreA